MNPYYCYHYTDSRAPLGPSRASENTLIQTDWPPNPRPSRFRRQARLARPSEPILLPKLRIEFADFPYLH